MFLLLVLASVALPTTFNFVEFIIQSQINVCLLERNDYHLGAYYMLKMYQQVMLGETNTKTFKDVTFKEGFALVVIIAVLFFF
jgi:NADH-quinone oxidoreductase subunit M